MGFLQSDDAYNVACASLGIVRNTPFIGENILYPMITHTLNVLQQTIQIVKYPIPSKEYVRSTVDTLMTSTKVFIRNSIQEVYFYTKLVDATVTRTLSHTQWRVLGSGPYKTLNHVNKQEVIDHLCERYFSYCTNNGSSSTISTTTTAMTCTQMMIARYELAAHIKFHNPSLYHDLVVTGLLLERGGEKTCNDTWLRSRPEYYDNGSAVVDPQRSNYIDTGVLLLREQREERHETIAKGTKRRMKKDKEMRDKGQCHDDCDNTKTSNMNGKRCNNKITIKPLWFYHPSQNGKKPRKDAPWVCFDRKEQHRIENGFVTYIQENSTITQFLLNGSHSPLTLWSGNNYGSMIESVGPLSSTVMEMSLI